MGQGGWRPWCPTPGVLCGGGPTPCPSYLVAIRLPPDSPVAVRLGNPGRTGAVALRTDDWAVLPPGGLPPWAVSRWLSREPGWGAGRVAAGQWPLRGSCPGRAAENQRHSTVAPFFKTQKITFANSTDWFVSFWDLVGGRHLGWGSEALGEFPSYGTPRLQGIKLPSCPDMPSIL